MKENPLSQEFVEVSLALGLKATTKKMTMTMRFFVSLLLSLLASDIAHS